MLDYTDRHFRVLMRQITRHSLLYTEMVVAQALHHARREPGAERPGGRLERLIGFDPCERPLALQVGGDQPDLLADAARLAADWGYDEINLNVGCPSEKVQQGPLRGLPDGRTGTGGPLRGGDGGRQPPAGDGEAPHRHRRPRLLRRAAGLCGHGGRRRLPALQPCMPARPGWQGLDPKQNRTIPPLRHDLVHRLKAERPQLTSS
jgi:tRNA-dihydrouridine synthase A